MTREEKFYILRTHKTVIIKIHKPNHLSDNNIPSPGWDSSMDKFIEKNIILNNNFNIRFYEFWEGIVYANWSWHIDWIEIMDKKMLKYGVKLVCL